MKKQNGFSLIGVLLIIGVLFLTAGGVAVWENKVAPTLPITPTPAEESMPNFPSTQQVTPGSCPRPTDQYGQRYQIQIGEFFSLEETTVILRRPHINMDSVTGYPIIAEMHDKLKSVEQGTEIVIFGYVTSSLSGANPGYSCVEIH